jgi:hypothetical protein
VTDPEILARAQRLALQGTPIEEIVRQTGLDRAEIEHPPQPEERRLAVEQYLVNVDEEPRRALQMLRMGKAPADIAAELGVAAHAIKVWNSEVLWVGLGFSPALARARASSEYTRPRDPSTVQAFESLVGRTLVPHLKNAGYRKRRLTWQRQRDAARSTVNVQRHHATGDLLQFTINWTLETLDPVRRTAAGRIGGFLPHNQDTWWSIQLGWLARDTPSVVEDPDVVEAEIDGGLRTLIEFLERPGPTSSG